MNTQASTTQQRHVLSLNELGIVNRLVELLRKGHRSGPTGAASTAFSLASEAARLGSEAASRRGGDFSDVARVAADVCRALLECTNMLPQPMAAHARVGCDLLADALERSWQRSSGSSAVREYARRAGE